MANQSETTELIVPVSDILFDTLSPLMKSGGLNYLRPIISIIFLGRKWGVAEVFLTPRNPLRYMKNCGTKRSSKAINCFNLPYRYSYNAYYVQSLQFSLSLIASGVKLDVKHQRRSECGRERSRAFYYCSEYAVWQLTFDCLIVVQKDERSEKGSEQWRNGCDGNGTTVPSEPKFFGY